MASRSRLHPNPSPWSRAPSPSFPRHSSSPLVHSPLQQSFPAYSDPSKSGPNSPGSPGVQQTPSRRSRPSGQGARPRGESRSSSVPVITRTQPQELGTGGEGPSRRSMKFRSRPSSRATSPLPSPGEVLDCQNRRSVKHLTCFWWWEKGECKYSEEDCLYAHHDTGHYTAAPRQVVPGEPAKAGRSLERALNKLAISNRSSASVSSLASPNVNNTQCESTGSGSNAVSRTDTPLIGHSRPSTPSPRMSMDQGHATHLQTDNEFLRSLVQQTQREKRALMDTIEALQAEKYQMTSQIEKMNQERSALLAEREILHATIKKLQFPAGAKPFAQSHGHVVPMRSPSATFPSNNPWGAIGSGSRGTSTSPIGTPLDSPAMQPRSFSIAAPGGPVGIIPVHPAGGTMRTSTKTTSDSTLDSTVPTPAAVNGNGSSVERENIKTNAQVDDTLVSSNMEGERLTNLLSSLGPTF
ncbi:uncharacterized protein Z519_09837 [Cladophialophora bantiana CBS 173.52]|uniref:C3H1-type domain-containing protein n=1 Tax=Cladophialophora bantiana (strain ATCC 10958 / CBS 173.52 / CDC B-1940 / NIH 8579) TaxID=1442370 RepID=A0A0D2EHX1_CLAB1|nr:uncharacterized protein Z519_09837 [Cladophialophora bantiana CBS 173.52]KIW89681.1 hypothetical protein Z519_09837 [Cladophialophora bantiana CBS 173.52]